MSFELHPSLAKKTFIIDLPLSRVLLQDESHYPWIFLVPRKNGIGKMIDLEREEQIQLMKELEWAQKIIWEHFQPTQLNVAAIGNKTPQLHVHVIGRNTDDPAWPGTVWDHPAKSPYPQERKDQIARLLHVEFQKYIDNLKM